MKPEYDAGADDYDARHAADPRTVRRAAILDGIQLDAVAGARRVLELGCGTGRLLAQVRAPLACGVDIAPRMLAHAVRRGLPVALADAHALPFADATFDGLIAGKGVFRYLDTPRALAECARVLAPGGVLALHQYGANTVTLFPGARHRGTGHLQSADDVEVPARAAGFVPRAFRRFRSIRIWPYLLEIPAIADRLGVQLWNHCVAILARPG